MLRASATEAYSSKLLRSAGVVMAQRKCQLFGTGLNVHLSNYFGHH